LLRHPATVAASIERRNDIAPVLGELMWLRTVYDILHELGERLVATIVYEDWFSNPAKNRGIINTLAFRLALATKSSWSVPIRTGERSALTRACQLAIAGQVYRELAAPDGCLAYSRLLQMIDQQVAAAGGWLPFGQEQYRKHSARRDLPFPISKPTEAGDGIPVDLVNGNSWCVRNRHGYQLHANKRGLPAAGLVWRGIEGKPQQSFVARVRPSSEKSPQLDLRIEMHFTEGDLYRAETFRLNGVSLHKIELRLPADRDCDVSLSVTIAEEIDHAYHAGLTIVMPRIAESR
jgi:hypothetical protein